MRFEYLAASARGPLHAELGTDNQDAWMAVRSDSGVVVAVADGMGSKPMAAVGARTACRAAVAAAEVWWKAVSPPAQALPGLIESIWRAWLGRVPPDEARATCLVAAASRQGDLVIATLGDGLALLASEENEVDVVTPERQGFGNETDALGRAASTRAWSVLARPQMAPGSVVLLTTDGVADDLVVERRAEFAHEVVTSFGSLPSWEGSVALWRALHEWPTPGHTGDKTVAVLWRPE